MMQSASKRDFIVKRDNLAETKFVSFERDPSMIAPRSILLRVDRFAFTANNITYAVLGDQLKYWHLFPAAQGWGVVPVWGFGEVIASRHDDVPEGERLFGYFPMSTHLVIEPAKVGERGLVDGASHRQSVSPVYNQYARVGSNAQFAGKSGDYQALLRPLFMLSFLVDDFLGEANFFGARSILLTSASSKTAIGLAYLLKRRGTVQVVGLTSASNLAFVEGLGCYDRVVAYDQIESMPASDPVAIVDMAGNAKLLASLHRHFGANVKYSCRVGLTHVDTEQPPDDLPGAKPQWFSATDNMKKRSQDWGKGGIESRIAEVWPALVGIFDRSTEIVAGEGSDAVRDVYRATLGGKVQPSKSHMLTLWS